jgi:hypothetical protein
MLIELPALFFLDGLVAARLIVSGVAMALGAFAAASPRRAAAIWGAHRLQNVAPERRASFVRWYRIFGIFLFLGGLLFAVDTILYYGLHFR